MSNIASYIDHTILAANGKAKMVSKICQEARENQFASVCVNSYRVSQVKKELGNCGVKVCSVVGFPLGAMSTQAKAFEAKQAIKDGADEIDMVINIGLIKDKNFEEVLNDIKTVKEACNGNLLKVIIETCLLNDEEKIIACNLSKQAGADYVKTSTGFSTGGAKAEDVALMRKIVGSIIGVKASGGVHSFNEANALIKAGASRIGASSGIKIIKESL